MKRINFSKIFKSSPSVLGIGAVLGVALLPQWSQAAQVSNRAICEVFIEKGGLSITERASFPSIEFDFGSPKKEKKNRETLEWKNGKRIVEVIPLTEFEELELEMNLYPDQGNFFPKARLLSKRTGKRESLGYAWSFVRSGDVASGKKYLTASIRVKNLKFEEKIEARKKAQDPDELPLPTPGGLSRGGNISVKAVEVNCRVPLKK